MYRYASTAETIAKGTYSKPAFDRPAATPPSPITSGTSFWAIATPMLPPAALSPSAQPFSLSGKK